jgi:tyrosyl-tRNA synthetase
VGILEDLEYRGLLFQETDRDGLTRALEQGPLCLYIGFDPTADSLHIGNLLAILILRRFQLAGHKPIALVGGATGLIGDPSGKKQERALNPRDTVHAWTRKIESQLARFIDFDAPNNPARVVNNYDWTASMGVIDFLRDVGKHFSINTMLNRESVAMRLETGLSFTEFSYMLLQANDFLELFTQYGCRLQVGGSDQWGNIVAGVDLIRRVTGGEAYGFTIPLVVQSDGTKFGKSEGNAVWLDAEKTSVYHFYQFWLNTADADVIRFLRYFTFLSPAEIAGLERAVAEQPDARLAQRVLAEQVTTLVHGQAAAERAQRLSAMLFAGDIKRLTREEVHEVFAGVPSTTVSAGQPLDIVSVLVASGASSSRRQAREDVAGGAITVNGDKITDRERRFSAEELIAGRFLVIRRGRRHYFLVQVEEAQADS